MELKLLFFSTTGKGQAFPRALKSLEPRPLGEGCFSALTQRPSSLNPISLGLLVGCALRALHLFVSVSLPAFPSLSVVL